MIRRDFLIDQEMILPDIDALNMMLRNLVLMLVERKLVLIPKEIHLAIVILYGKLLVILALVIVISMRLLYLNGVNIFISNDAASRFL